MHADDMDLVREFATSGSEAAFATLVRRHVNLVYSAALRRLGNAPEAEEVAQNVFIILARKAGGLRRGTILSGWLYQTAQLTAANFQRAAIRRQHREQEAFMQFYESSEPNASWHQLSPLLEEAMARLGQNERDAIVLRFFENRTVREVAAALGLREDAAQKRVNRATDKLRDYFVRRGVQVSTAALLASLGTHAVQAAPVELASKIAATAALKAAAGSSSTLTLIKGALKIMAWTKAKTAIVSGVVVLLAAGTATVTIKEIREHRTYSWQVQDYATRRKILNEAPPMVKLVPTKFPPSQGYTMVNGKTLGTGISLSTLLCSIYDSSPDRVVAAEPLPKGNVDFIATLPDGKSNSAALQREIEKQFHLVGRKEMRDADVLLLTVKNRNAPGLKRSTVTSNMTNLDSPPGRYDGSNVPLAYFARFLEYYFGTPVLDRTEIAYRLDINLKWDEPDPQNRDPEAMKRLLLNELGLELVPSREEVEMLVVERAKN